MDLNDVTEGTYLLVAPFWDEYKSKPGQPFDFVKHRRGAVLHLDVEQARRLVEARAVVAHDPDNPKYAVAADGSVVEVVPPVTAGSGLVLTPDQLAAVGLSMDASGEDVVLAVQALQRATAEAQAKADAAATANQGDLGQVSTGLPRPASDSIVDIVAWVGGDKGRAQVALDGERGTKDRPRPSLVTQLEEIITAPGGSA